MEQNGNGNLDGRMQVLEKENRFLFKFFIVILISDSMTWNDDQPKDEEDEENDEVENELEWRKQRHEREVFLEEVFIFLNLIRYSLIRFFL